MNYLEKLREIACPPLQLPVLKKYLARDSSIEGGFIWDSQGNLIGSHCSWTIFRRGAVIPCGFTTGHKCFNICWSQLESVDPITRQS